MGLTTKQVEAHLNEYKGNILEFLLGKKLAVKNNLLDQFLSTIDDYYFEQLSHYESKIRFFDSSLLNKLDKLASKASSYLQQEYPTIECIELIGKKQQKDKYASHYEGDLQIIADAQKHLLSIKLCKASSFVNTKSGGVRSFLSRYFGQFVIQEIEQQFNQFIDQQHTALLHNLYQLAGLEFYGKYDHQWVESGLSELPGELNREMRSVLHQYYANVAHRLHSILYKLWQQDSHLFRQSLMTILGFGSSEVSQLLIYHTNDYQLSSLYLTHYPQMWHISKKLSFKEFKKNTSSFELLLDNLCLQIRLKPMNKFVAAAMKVNCAVFKPSELSGVFTN